MTPISFQQHLSTAGGLSRRNPELARLAELTGYSLEHLFKVATGKRSATSKCRKAVTAHVPGLGDESFGKRNGGNGHGDSASDAGDGGGAS